MALTDTSLNTLSYSEMNQAFVSFLSSNPKWYLDFKNKYYSFDSSNNMRLHNSSVALSNELSIKPVTVGQVTTRTADRSFVRLLVNGEYAATKVFDNIKYSADNIDSYTQSFIFKTSKQISKQISNADIENREETYKFAIPRQKDIEFFAPRMVGKYMVLDLALSGNNADVFILPYIETTYRYSMI